MTDVLRRIAYSVVILAVAGASLHAVGAQTAQASASSAKAKELVALMKTKKMEVFVARDSSAPGRFVAVMHVPDVQLLLVSAAYSRASDIEFRIYQKDWMTGYRDLSAGSMSTERFLVEDVVADGLVALPIKNSLPDTVSNGTGRHVFEGPADPRRRNDKRMAADAYQKAFADADQRYAKLLDELIAELKKIG